MGFCDSFEFSSLGISADDFADVFVICLQLRLLSRLMRLENAGFSFRHVDSVLPLLSASRRMLLILGFLSCYCLLSLIMFFMYLTMLSDARSFRLCGRVLLFGRWPKFLLRHVRPIFVRLLLCLFCPRGLSD
jgi:hypothetical protein